MTTPDREYQKGMADEVVGNMRAEIDEFARALIVAGKAINKALDAQVDKVEAGAGGLRVHRPDLIKEVRKQLSEGVWGDDEMTAMLARTIVNGDFVY